MQMENLSALNQYQNNQRDLRRGESSKSRASVRSTNQYAAQSSNHNRGIDDLQPAYTMTNSKNTIYNSKYNLRSTDQTAQNVKGTPQQQLGQKLSMKQ